MFIYVGVNDIKNHRFLNCISFDHLYSKRINPPYRPTVKGPSDTSNFHTCVDVSGEGAEIKACDDPFLKWAEWLITYSTC